MTAFAIVIGWLAVRRQRGGAAATAMAIAAAIAAATSAKGVGRWAARFALANARNLLFTAGLAAVSVGLWWERPSLALIVPGTVVCGGMFAAWWRMTSCSAARGDGEDR